MIKLKSLIRSLTMLDESLSNASVSNISDRFIRGPSDSPDMFIEIKITSDYGSQVLATVSDGFVWWSDKAAIKVEA